MSPGYFETMRIPVLQGRGIEATDRIGAPGVAVINRTLAQQVWPDGDALGQRILMGGGATDSVWRTVVGIVGDVRHRGSMPSLGRRSISPTRSSRPVPEPRCAPCDWCSGASGDPAELTGALRAALAELDPDIPLAEVQTMEEALGAWAAERRLTMLLVGGFAAAGAHSRRGGGVRGDGASGGRSELARSASGSHSAPCRGRFSRLVLSQGAWLAGVGIGAGLAGALAARRACSPACSSASARPIPPLSWRPPRAGDGRGGRLPAPRAASHPHRSDRPRSGANDVRSAPRPALRARGPCSSRRVSPSSPWSPWRSASAPTPRSSAW